jgi:hypothetical protein
MYHIGSKIVKAVGEFTVQYIIWSRFWKFKFVLEKDSDLRKKGVTFFRRENH